MTEKENKRGSNGGNARSQKLSKEERKAIASKAAKDRWDKVRAEKEGNKPIESTDPIPSVTLVPEPVPQSIVVSSVPTPPPSPEPKPTKAKKRVKLPKEFGAAHSYAEKRLAEAIRERAEAANKVAVLNAEIPSLVQIIKALKSTEASIPSFFNSQAYLTPPMPIAQGIDPMSQASNLIQQANIPPAPLAQGGAVDFDGAQQELPEDAFLRGTVGGDKGWV